MHLFLCPLHIMDAGLYGLTPLIADIRGIFTRYNWIADLTNILDAPLENFINANYLPLPQVGVVCVPLKLCFDAQLLLLSAPLIPQPHPVFRSAPCCCHHRTTPTLSSLSRGLPGTTASWKKPPAARR